VKFETISFSHILEEPNRTAHFLSHTAFVVSHKSESLDTLLGVIWYLPLNSPIIIVTNCPREDLANLKDQLALRLAHRNEVFLLHQKDPLLAHHFAERCVQQIIGSDGTIRDGKGEAMYIGTLAAQQLGYVQWIIYYDADNFVPSALLEYTLAMGKLFRNEQPLNTVENVRICWSSKPALGEHHQSGVRVLGRCSRVVSPLCTELLKEWFGICDRTVITSNAGEQGLTMHSATNLRFSSGYSVETLHMLDLFYNASIDTEARNPTLVQYEAKSPHFHDKKDDEHIKKMIAESLGAFWVFKTVLPPRIEHLLLQTYEGLALAYHEPVVYPPVRDIYREGDEQLIKLGSLFQPQESGAALLA